MRLQPLQEKHQGYEYNLDGGVECKWFGRRYKGKLDIEDFLNQICEFEIHEFEDVLDFQYPIANGGVNFVNVFK